MKLKPMADNVLLKQNEAQETTVSGIILATTNKEKPAIYEVVAVGPGTKDVSVTVKPGDKVVMGDTIGYAADSAIVESTLGSHVHFSVTHYDEPMDPEEFLSLGN